MDLYSIQENIVPEDDVPSLVSLPSFDKGKVSHNGPLHDVVSAIKLAHLCTVTSQTWPNAGATAEACWVYQIIDWW